MEELDVTVCVLSLNRPLYLCDAIDSILKQTIKPKEIFIFDNGSRDDVFKAIAPYLENGVHWIGSEVTNTAFWNFKRAIEKASTNYVFVMHDDDRLCFDFLEKQLNFLKNNPKVGAVSCNGYFINEDGVRSGHLLRSDFVNNKPEFYKNSVEVALRYASDSCIPCSPVVYQTELVKNVGFREEFGKVSDAVFFCDISEKQIVAYQPEALYECRLHSGQDSSYFPPEALTKLTIFFWNLDCSNKTQLEQLHQLLIKQHTSRILRSTLNFLKSPASSKALFLELIKVQNPYFSIIVALRIIGQFFVKLIRTRFFRKANFRKISFFTFI